jgi:hypothetical protein
MNTCSIADLAKRYIEVKDIKADLIKQAEEAGSDLEELSIQLFDYLIGSELDKVSIEGYSFKPVLKMYGSIPADMQEAAFAVLREQGHGGLIKETIAHQTLGAWLREQSDACSGELPGWITENIHIYKKKEISARKGS